MFSFLKRQGKVTKLYADLPPSERITKLFEERIEPVLSQHGFKFVKSKLLFKRKIGPLTHEISISKSKWNRADEVCSFWLVFNVYADTYNDWHKEKYGTLPLNNVVSGFYHNHLKNWKTEYPLDKYDLSKQDNEKVIEEIAMNLEKLVLPILNKYTNYETAADTLMQEKQFWLAAKIYDFYLMVGKSDKAKQVLLKGKEFFEEQVDSQREFYYSFQLRFQEL